MRADKVGIVDPGIVNILAGLHLGLDLFDDVTFLDDVVLDLDPGDLLERLRQRLGLIFVHGEGLGDRVDLHALVRRSGLDEPLHLLHLVFLGQRRRLKLRVDPLLGGGFIRESGRGKRGRRRRQCDGACHHPNAGPDRRTLSSLQVSLQVSHVISSVAAIDVQARVAPGSAIFRSVKPCGRLRRPRRAKSR